MNQAGTIFKLYFPQRQTFNSFEYKELGAKIVAELPTGFRVTVAIVPTV